MKDFFKLNCLFRYLNEEVEQLGGNERLILEERIGLVIYNQGIQFVGDIYIQGLVKIL